MRHVALAAVCSLGIAAGAWLECRSSDVTGFGRMGIYAIATALIFITWALCGVLLALEAA